MFDKMKYRILGRTGLKLSELGLGAHEYRRWLNTIHFKNDWDPKEFLETQPQRNKIIEKAINSGVNFFESTLKEEAESLGLALKALGRRNEVYLSAMLVFPLRMLKDEPPSRWRDILLEELEGRFRLLQTDHIDLFHVHMPEDNYLPDRLKAFLEILKELKAQGRIGFIGTSSHEIPFLAELIRKYDCFDEVMIRYNYHLQEAREALFPLCKALNIGVVVMKPLSWPYYGIPFTYFCADEVKPNTYTPAQTSIHWILRAPEVTTVVPSVNSMLELEDNLSIFDAEYEVDEKVLKRCLETAQSPKGKEILRRLVEHPAKDIRNYAKEALECVTF
jgi:aryl-alcohol dehydrogenase-like predicted oxidoreductase